MREVLKIYSEWLTPIGEKDREEVHRDGDWHESFHCWFYKHEENRSWIYFQKRADSKKDFPSLYDISAAGHIAAEESLIRGGLREVEEELGLRLAAGQLNYCGFYKEELLFKTIKDREICHIYLFPYENHMKLTINEEVGDVVRIDLEDFLSMICKKSPCLQAESIFTGEELHLSHSSFCPHPFDYYQYVVQAILSSR